MFGIERKRCLRARATFALAVYAAAALSPGMVSAQVRGNSRLDVMQSVIPVYGIPPSANTQRALDAPRGVVEGILTGFYASLGVAVGRTDNVNRVPKSSLLYDSDAFTLFTPRLGYQTALGRHRALIDYTGYAEGYQEFSNLDSVDHRLRGTIDFDLTRRMKSGIFAGYADVNERRGTSGSQVLQIEPNEVEIVDYGANLRYGTTAARHMQLRFGIEADDWRYQNNEQQFRDRDTSGAFGELHYNVTGKTSVFLLGTYREFEYTNVNATVSDSEETSVQLGAEWRATPKTLGRVSVGRQDKEFKDTTITNVDITTYNARLRWQPKSYTGVSLYGSQRFEETTSILGNFYKSALWGVKVDHAFTSRWIVDLYYNNINDDFDNGRKDEYHDFGVGVNYLFRRWLSFGARYGYIERDSNVAINNYVENIFGFTLQLSYQQ